MTTERTTEEGGSRMTYTVVIRTKDTGEAVHRIRCGGDREGAHKVERGVNINLNAAKFYTEIETEEAAR